MALVNLVYNNLNPGIAFRDLLCHLSAIILGSIIDDEYAHINAGLIQYAANGLGQKVAIIVTRDDHAHRTHRAPRGPHVHRRSTPVRLAHMPPRSGPCRLDASLEQSDYISCAARPARPGYGSA